MKKIAVFASGTGSNAVNLIDFFENSPEISVSLIVSNNENAPVLKKAADKGVKTLLINKESFYHQKSLIETLSAHKIDFIVLAGFLWLIPEYLVQAFQNKMINIHPALLPAYGGKGMYGKKVHEAVLKNGDQVSGITIHYVNEAYDEGQRIFQAKCTVNPGETPESLASKIHSLEHAYLPIVVESLLS